MKKCPVEPLLIYKVGTTKNILAKTSASCMFDRSYALMCIGHVYLMAKKR